MCLIWDIVYRVASSAEERGERYLPECKKRDTIEL